MANSQARWRSFPFNVFLTILTLQPFISSNTNSIKLEASLFIPILFNRHCSAEPGAIKIYDCNNWKCCCFPLVLLAHVKLAARYKDRFILPPRHRVVCKSDPKNYNGDNSLLLTGSQSSSLPSPTNDIVARHQIIFNIINVTYTASCNLSHLPRRRPRQVVDQTIVLLRLTNINFTPKYTFNLAPY